MMHLEGKLSDFDIKVSFSLNKKIINNTIYQLLVKSLINGCQEMIQQAYFMKNLLRNLLLKRR